jgi:hypothetical protein
MARRDLAREMLAGRRGAQLPPLSMPGSVTTKMETTSASTDKGCAGLILDKVRGSGEDLHVGKNP